MTFRQTPAEIPALIAAWRLESTDNRFGLGWRAGERVAELQQEQERNEDERK